MARVISHYNHFCYKRGDHDCKGVPLEQLSEEKLADILRIFGNIQIRFIINESGRLLKRPNKKLVAKAMENLKNGYDCFGVLERLEESLNLLKHSAPSWLKLPEKFPFKNKNKTEAPPVPEWVIAKIREKNQCDVLLYEEALKLFDQMLDKR